MGEKNNGKIELQKNLTLINCVSIIVGIIVGSGIFITPKDVIADCGSVGLALIIWASCGVFSIFGALAYSELGCMIPKAGGEYEYLMASFGNLFGFLFIWTFVSLMIPASLALTAGVFAEYVLKPFYRGCEIPFEARILLGTAALTVITVVNCVSVRMTNILQNVFNIGKVVGLLMIVVLGVYALAIGQVDNFEAPFAGSETNPGKLAKSFYAGMYSYSGWSFLNYVVEEIKNPNKVLPFSIFIGLGIVILIYIAANVAYFALLNPREMVASTAVAFTFAEKIMGEYSWVVSIFVALSTLGYINGAFLSTSRTIFGAARNSHMPSLLAFINIRFLTPITSIIFLAVVSFVFIFIKDLSSLIQMTMLSEYIFIGATVAGLLWLRKTQPNVKRPIKVNLFFPCAFLLIALFTIAMSFVEQTNESLFCLLVILTGIPVYYLFVIIEKPKSIQDKIDSITIFTQKLTYSIFDESKLN